MSALALDGSWEPARMLGLFGQTLLVTALFVIVQLALHAQFSRPPEPAPIQVPASTVLDRLPERLRGAELLAVEAEDHYLRFHTDRGSALMLMKLGDAAAELAGLDGARTHRSWWVARPAVLSATRGGGRASLNLKAGLVAPVSRTFAPRLRQAGWF
jgi:DNA-binding LytR/AlgR family response regulator